jgi:SAM-dependent methyltransferase
LDPQPDDAVLAAIYGNRYFLGADDPAAAARRAQMKTATAGLYLDMLAAMLRPSTNNAAALLEIGCGHGEVLREARQRGFRISGLEVSAHAAAAANQLLGESAVRAGALENTDFSGCSFDAILAADVIEHLRDPLAFLIRIRALLAPNGVLLLITPSLASWTRRLLGRHWMEYKVEHLFYFSPASMRQILERAGFGDIAIRPNRKVVTSDYLSQHFDRFRVPLLSPLLAASRHLLPARVAHRHLRLPASGLMASARILSVPPPDPHFLGAGDNRLAKGGAPARDTTQ